MAVDFVEVRTKTKDAAGKKLIWHCLRLNLHRVITLFRPFHRLQVCKLPGTCLYGHLKLFLGGGLLRQVPSTQRYEPSFAEIYTWSPTIVTILRALLPNRQYPKLLPVVYRVENILLRPFTRPPQHFGPGFVKELSDLVPSDASMFISDVANLFD